MSGKVVVIISTAEKDKALTGILYATNGIKKNWLEDVKVFFFGPFEKLVATDEEIQTKVKELMQYQTPVACKLISDNNGVSDDLLKLGFELEYIGSSISDLIKQGYVPMVF